MPPISSSPSSPMRQVTPGCGRPIGTTSPDHSVTSATVAPTVVSVGPYVLNSRTAPPTAACQRRTASGRAVSPPMITHRTAAGSVASPRSRAATSWCQYAVGRSRIVIPSASQRSKNRSGLLIMSSSRRTSVAPRSSGQKISSTLVSKLSEANCRIRSPSAKANRFAKASVKSRSCRRPTRTPFGRPVEPEVKMTYAGSRRRTLSSSGSTPSVVISARGRVSSIIRSRRAAG